MTLKSSMAVVIFGLFSFLDASKTKSFDKRRSGLSESACKSSPARTVALALFEGSGVTVTARSSTVTCCATARFGAEASATYSPGVIPVKEYDPSLPATSRIRGSSVGRKRYLCAGNNRAGLVGDDAT